MQVGAKVCIYEEEARLTNEKNNNKTNKTVIIKQFLHFIYSGTDRVLNLCT